MTIYQDRPDRRAFLARLTGAAAAASITGAAAWWLSGRAETASQPVAPEKEGPTFLFDGSIPGLKPRLAIAKGSDRVATVNEALDALGGLSGFVQPGERVILKVNAAFASPPALGATTHPDLVAEVVRLCLAAGASKVRVTDNPVNDPASCFALSGIADAARKAGAEVVLPTDGAFSPFTLPRARILRDWPMFTEPLLEADRIIGVVPVKDHYLCGASMTIKNWYGLLGGRRNRLHQDIHTLLAELARLVRPTLVILDGTESMVRNGPTGGTPSDLEATHTMVVSTDPVAADAFAASLLGRSLTDLPWLALAQAAGAGSTDWASIRVGS